MRPDQIKIKKGGTVSIWRQIFQQIVDLIASGQLKHDDQLIPIFTLAKELELNPNTIVKVYRELEISGLVVKRGTRGTFVALNAKASIDVYNTRRLQRLCKKLLKVASTIDMPIDKLVAVLLATNEDLSK